MVMVEGAEVVMVEEEAVVTVEEAAVVTVEGEVVIMVLHHLRATVHRQVVVVGVAALEDDL